VTPREDDGVSASPLVAGLAPRWSVGFLPDFEWLITGRLGTLRRVVDGAMRSEPVTGVPEVVAKGQGGLFDVVPHPHFADNRRLYISYAKACDGGATTAVGHGLYADGELKQFQDVFIADACTDTAKHFGGRILFDNDGYLFITVGDRGQRERAQDTGGHGGSVIRVIRRRQRARRQPAGGAGRRQDRDLELGPPQPPGAGAASGHRRALAQ